jgi:hypothetical protein
MYTRTYARAHTHTHTAGEGENVFYEDFLRKELKSPRDLKL